MAHKNIDERRLRVAAELLKGPHITHDVRRQIAAEFSCALAAINADIVAITRPRTRASAFPTPQTKAFVLARDRSVCRYCEGLVQGSAIIVEHIIPAAIGGVGQPHNLVAACQSCNATKMRNVWIPCNLAAITKNHPEWRDAVLSLGTVPIFITKKLLAHIDAAASNGAISRNEFIVNTLQSVVG